MGEKKILLAESEKIIALDLKRLLSDYGYQVIDIIYNSSLILSYMQRQKPDLFITGLKNNPNAVSLLKTITEDFGVPVLILTGVQENELTEVKKIAKCSFLKKPFQKDELLNAVKLAIL